MTHTGTTEICKNLLWWVGPGNSWGPLEPTVWALCATRCSCCGCPAQGNQLLGEVSEGGAEVWLERIWLIELPGIIQRHCIKQFTEVTQWYLSEDYQIENLKTWGETLQNLHPPMMWAHIDWVGRVVRSVASSKVAMMMWLWQHSHAWKHGTREVTFTLRFEDVWLSSEHRTSFWKQVSKFFTLCFHENSLRQPKVLPFRSALFRPRSFFSSRKPRAVTRGRHSGGAGWIGGPWPAQA